MSASQLNHVKSAALACCALEHRANVRFVGPKRRRFSTRITIENLESSNMYDFCNAIYPSQCFIRHSGSGNELSTASRVDVYVPIGIALHLYFMYRGLYALSIASFGLAVYIMNKRV
jgi:hypothetical protein